MEMPSGEKCGEEDGCEALCDWTRALLLDVLKESIEEPTDLQEKS